MSEAQAANPDAPKGCGFTGKKFTGSGSGRELIQHVVKDFS
jgi:hypothetical protein